MFGFGKKSETGFKDLPEVRDLMKELLGNTMNVYVGVTIGYLASLGNKTAKDVEKARTDMLTALQKYVQAEILLYNQNHGYEPDLAELAGLRLK